jgi:3-deoxy-7-phosphoheptulonate synthase
MNPELPPLSVTRETPAAAGRAPASSTVVVGGVRFGGEAPIIIAGPCAVESREQTLEIAEEVARAGARMLRGGAFKPRTSPHDFQGLGEAGLEILAAARDETGLPVVSEVLDPGKVAMVASYADMIQIGSRNMQNFPLLREVGLAGKPVLLKRGFSATVEEWICAAEHIAVTGNRHIVMCERGIRTFADGTYSRATLDLAAIDAVRRLTPFPVIVDPSHAAGRADLVFGLALAALCQGAHGLIIEVIAAGTDRSTVLCDGAQGIEPDVLRRIVAAVPAIADLL